MPSLSPVGPLLNNREIKPYSNTAEHPGRLGDLLVRAKERNNEAIRRLPTRVPTRIQGYYSLTETKDGEKQAREKKQ